ncbi:hypothetical protein [Gemmatimonas sp.]|jgi:hypothetical protein|uniref:hypothetical protein n=1 Tax=Gemmatimonas sp. TaxID=1962908 RepID=UPI0031CAA780|nr:hypothetical protein [Gemmatimonas sp.]
MTFTHSIAGVAFTVLAFAACGDRDKTDNTMMGDSVAATSNSGGTLSGDDVDIEGLALGRTVGTDGKITDKLEEFRTTDTIVAVVETNENDAGKELSARWTYGDDEQLIEEQRQTVAAGEKARTMFRLTKASAWPVGTYHVRLLHNGKEVKSADFTVK